MFLLTCVWIGAILMGMKRTTIWLSDLDRGAIALVRERYGISNDSDALRVAVHIIAKADRIKVADIRRVLRERKGQDQ